MKETYEAQGECINCGRENYPQWGSYDKGKKIEEYPCPACDCMTWVPRGFNKTELTSDVGCTNECPRGVHTH